MGKLYIVYIVSHIVPQIRPGTGSDSDHVLFIAKVRLKFKNVGEK